jgi:L-amino acid N-acyltransferase YncA
LILDLIQVNKYFSQTEFEQQLKKVLEPYLKDREGGGSAQQRIDEINTEFYYCGIVVTNQNKYEAHCVLYLNPHIQHNNQSCLLLGNFHCGYNYSISEKMLKAAQEVALNKNAKYLIGPMNGSTWNHYRFITQPPVHLFYGNHHYYEPALTAFAQFGFLPIAKYYSSIDRNLMIDAPLANMHSDQFKKVGLTIRQINKHHYEEELLKLFQFNLTAFQKNLYYSPISWSQFKHKYLEVLDIIDEKFVLIAEDSANNIVGFIFCYRNFYSKQNELIVKTIARHPDAKWKGLGQLLAQKIIQVAKEEDYGALIHAFLIEDGTSSPLSQKHSQEIISHYSLFAMPLA